MSAGCRWCRGVGNRVQGAKGARYRVQRAVKVQSGSVMQGEEGYRVQVVQREVQHVECKKCKVHELSQI